MLVYRLFSTNSIQFNSIPEMFQLLIYRILTFKDVWQLIREHAYTVAIDDNQKRFYFCLRVERLNRSNR